MLKMKPRELYEQNLELVDKLQAYDHESEFMTLEETFYKGVGCCWCLDGIWSKHLCLIRSEDRRMSFHMRHMVLMDYKEE